jgi:hypothetical protein
MSRCGCTLSLSRRRATANKPSMQPRSALELRCDVPFDALGSSTILDVPAELPDQVDKRTILGMGDSDVRVPYYFARPSSSRKDCTCWGRNHSRRELRSNWEDALSTPWYRNRNATTSPTFGDTDRLGMRIVPANNNNGRRVLVVGAAGGLETLMAISARYSIRYGSWWEQWTQARKKNVGFGQMNDWDQNSFDKPSGGLAPGIYRRSCKESGGALFDRRRHCAGS